MALKRNFQSLETFSMSSMTDVIFLLLIFFMVTSTIIFPAAIDVNLPQSSEQTSEKPVTEVYIDSESKYYLVVDRNDSVVEANTSPREISLDELTAELVQIHSADSTRSIALYADSVVDYGQVVNVLDMAAKNDMHIVLATKAKSVKK
ncbi:MAG: biopolymer transporter ExbD [Bacteroides sp.]|nr:biopolymer transporter ExbD [Bacteroides sp.]MDE7441589.1 biopolymer transporter ExbD [Muribaculaceae bacterium]